VAYEDGVEAYVCMVGAVVMWYVFVLHRQSNCPFCWRVNGQVNGHLSYRTKSI